MTQEEKKLAHEILLSMVPTERGRLAAIDQRLAEYFDGLTYRPDMHNGYELLCGVKFLRLLRTYDFNTERVQQVIRLREGEWQKDTDGRWKHIRGGIKCPGTDTAHVYRWQPFQVFVLASVFGFHTWFNTEVLAIDKPELLPTEREREDGMVEDWRRLCNYFVLYTPRKTDKTGMSAYIQVVFFLMGDYNSEIYCCANAEFQSRILYGRTMFMLADMDTRKRFDFTKRQITWKAAYHTVRNAMIMPLTAGGKTKDGPFAELVNWDELGSSPYVNGKSDMMGLVNVMRSSMGPRREGLTFGTTTAGTITTGPFIEILEGLHQNLLRELKFHTGEAEPTLSDDRQLCLLLEPDDWEKHDEQLLLTSKTLRRKINPMLGITCQHQFYEDSITDMYNGKMTKAELFSKLFNVYESGRVTEWIKADKIRTLQVDGKRIDDCVYWNGWRVFVGLDFSHGDDLFAITYLGVNYTPSNSMRGRFFADCDAWVLEATLNNSPNKHLYELWIQEGWLHVCPGEVFDSAYAINAMASRLFAPKADGTPDKQKMRLDIRGFGYDPAQSVSPINNLKAWLQTLFYSRGDVSVNELAGVIKQMVVPVSQSAMTMNPLIGHLEEMILAPEPWIEFSASPLWPFCFGCAAIEYGRNDLRRVCKGGAVATHKIDCVHALLDATYLFDMSEGRVSE